MARWRHLSFGIVSELKDFGDAGFKEGNVALGLDKCWPRTRQYYSIRGRQYLCHDIKGRTESNPQDLTIWDGENESMKSSRRGKKHHAWPEAVSWLRLCPNSPVNEHLLSFHSCHRTQRLVLRQIMPRNDDFLLSIYTAAKARSNNGRRIAITNQGVSKSMSSLWRIFFLYLGADIPNSQKQ